MDASPIHRLHTPWVRLTPPKDTLAAPASIDPTDRSLAWAGLLVVTLINGGVLLRALLAYRGTRDLPPVLVLLSVYFLLCASYGLISRRAAAYPSAYVLLQAGLIFLLLHMARASDWFAILFAPLTSQVAPRFSGRQMAAWIGLFTGLAFTGMVRNFELPRALPTLAVYTSVCVLLAGYAGISARARSAHARNRALQSDLELVTHQLERYTSRLKELAAARERTRLARDLHDSVTQTLFSMTLAARTARVFLERGDGPVAEQLDRLQELAAAALTEMRALVANLSPVRGSGGGMLAALQQHIWERRFRDRLTVDLRLEAPGQLRPLEEDSLLQIVREALNNVVKHAGVAEAQVRLHLTRPAFVEVSDAGRGFLPGQLPVAGHMGLDSMRQRADEIGWRLVVSSQPGGGARVRAEERLQEDR